MKTSIMTKDQFKKRWESDENGGGITLEDIADCAKSWGLFAKPKINDINIVLDCVLEAAGIKK
jgi:hypothetical protein